MLAAPAGSTPMISVSFPRVFRAVISPEMTPPPPIGATTISISGSSS